MKSKRTGIIFDLGNVLFKLNFDKPLNRMARLTGLSREDLLSAFRGDRIHSEFERGELTTNEFLNRFRKLLPVEIDMDVLLNLYCDIFTDVLLEREFIEKLCACHDLYILSNTNQAHFNYLHKKYPIWHMFDKIFLSFEIGVMKPAPEIYSYLLKRVPQSASELVFIDDIIENVQGAQKAGIRGILFEGAGKLKRQLANEGFTTS